MTSKTTYTATAPDGTTFTRNSGRTYTHAVLVRFAYPDGVNVWRAENYASSEQNARKASTFWKIGMGYGQADVTEVKIVAVNQ